MHFLARYFLNPHGSPCHEFSKSRIFTLLDSVGNCDSAVRAGQFCPAVTAANCSGAATNQTCGANPVVSEHRNRPRETNEEHAQTRKAGRYWRPGALSSILSPPRS